jgi:hypothetical protein
VKLTSNATWNARTSLAFKTSAGADYVNVETDGGRPGDAASAGWAKRRTDGDEVERRTNNQLPKANKTLGL